MILYSTGAMAILGNLEESQMQTFIVERLASTNQAFINSEVPITFNPVYIGLVRSRCPFSLIYTGPVGFVLK